MPECTATFVWLQECPCFLLLYFFQAYLSPFTFMAGAFGLGNLSFLQPLGWDDDPLDLGWSCFIYTRSSSFVTTRKLVAPFSNYVLNLADSFLSVLVISENCFIACCLLGWSSRLESSTKTVKIVPPLPSACTTKQIKLKNKQDLANLT